mgnify:CR=1 FL=1
MVPSVVVRSGSCELRALSLAVFSPQSRGLATYGWPLVSGLQRTCCPLWSAWISLGLLSGSLRSLRVCTYTHTPSFQCNNVFCSMSILISILHHLFQWWYLMLGCLVLLWAPLLLTWDFSKLAMSGLAEFILVSHLVSFQSWFPNILLILFGLQSWMSCTLGNKMAHSGSFFFLQSVSHILSWQNLT